MNTHSGEEDIQPHLLVSNITHTHKNEQKNWRVNVYTVLYVLEREGEKK